VINKLMRSTTIVLQDIEVFGTGCYGDFLCDGLYFEGSLVTSCNLTSQMRGQMASKVRILDLGPI
jgi:hypothetical protein